MFLEEGGLLYTTGRRVYVPKWANLRRTLNKKGHDSTWGGHLGKKRTLVLIEAFYYWPRMRDDVEAYVRTFLICQQDKVETKLSGGLLEPLPITEKHWDSVTIDFITCFSNSKGFGTIMIMLDRFSKYATSLPRRRTARQKRLPGSFCVLSLSSGASLSISSVIGILDLLHFSTSFHPQTDGQTERINALLECYLQHYVSANQKHWAKLLDIAQFS